MKHFLVRPDFDIVSKYYTLQDSVELMKVFYADGYPIVIDCYCNSKGEWFYTDDHINEVEIGFKAILRKYGLQVHYENLLFLVLNKKWEIDQVSFALEDEYVVQKRAQELAKLLLAFKDTAENQYQGLQLKTTNSNLSPVVKDKKLISWLGSLLIDAIDQEKEPIGLLSLTGDKFLRGTIEKLKEVANRRIANPNAVRKKYLADFCLNLYPYLVSETNIRPDAKTLVSDNQLNFYFDTLVLLGMLNSDKIHSEPKDYMRTLLKNHLIKLSASISGK